MPQNFRKKTHFNPQTKKPTCPPKKNWELGPPLQQEKEKHITEDWITGMVPLAVLWLAMHQPDVDNMVALMLAEAAGLGGHVQDALVWL